MESFEFRGSGIAELGGPLQQKQNVSRVRIGRIDHEILRTRLRLPGRLRGQADLQPPPFQFIDAQRQEIGLDLPARQEVILAAWGQGEFFRRAMPVGVVALSILNQSTGRGLPFR